MFPMSGLPVGQTNRCSLPARHSLLSALVVLFVAVSLLSACVSGSDENTRESAQTATSGTQTRQDAPMQTPYEVARLSSPRSGTEELFLIPQGSEQIGLDLAAGDTLTVSYSSITLTFGGHGYPDPAVDLMMLDPFNLPLIEVEPMAKNSVRVKAEVDGVHQLVFGSPFHLLSPQEVTVEYAINP